MLYKVITYGPDLELLRTKASEVNEALGAIPGVIALGYRAPDVPSPSLKRGRKPDEEYVITSYSIHYTKLYELRTAHQISWTAARLALTGFPWLPFS